MTGILKLIYDLLPADDFTSVRGCVRDVGCIKGVKCVRGVRIVNGAWGTLGV